MNGELLPGHDFGKRAVYGHREIQETGGGFHKWGYPKIDLVGGLIHFLFSHILGIIIPIDSYFSEGFKPPTRDALEGKILLRWMIN